MGTFSVNYQKLPMSKNMKAIGIKIKVTDKSYQSTIICKIGKRISNFVYPEFYFCIQQGLLSI